VRQPGDLPPSVAIPRRSGSESAAPAAPMQSRLEELAAIANTGRNAVTFSKKKEELREAEKLSTISSSDSANQIRRVAGKTFYLRDGVWTDSEFKAEAKLPVVTLKFAGDAYFDLIGQEPKLAECFALGQRVVVVWKGKVYRVEE